VADLASYGPEEVKTRTAFHRSSYIATLFLIKRLSFAVVGAHPEDPDAKMKIFSLGWEVRMCK
jgi:hypothetical protein